MYLIIHNYKTYITLSRQFDLNDEVYEITLKDTIINPEPNEQLIPLKLFTFECLKTEYTFSFKSDFVNISILPSKYFDVVHVINGRSFTTYVNRRSKTLSLELIKELDIKRNLIKEINDFNAKYPNFVLLYNLNDFNSINKAIELKTKFEEIVDEINNFNKIQ